MTNDPLIITCAVVGAELTKEDTPHLPITPDEIAASAKEAAEAGATIIHLHIRDKAGQPSQDVDIFRTVSDKIRNACDCILQFSTGGAVGTPLSERCAPLTLKPEMATLSMGTMNFGPDIYENSVNTIRTIATEIKNNHILPELEIFDAGMLDTTFSFLKRGHLPEKHHINFVLGVPGGLGGSIRNLIFLADQLDKTRSWGVAGIGRYQLPLAMAAITMGGHVRVGFEDNINYHKGEPARSNAQFVARIVRISEEFGRPVARLDDTRKILGL
ncbi:MAG: 3-keto-5-aminohexanoate cleavage protein [Desulfobacterales bacterium]